MLNNKKTWIVLVSFTVIGAYTAGLAISEALLVFVILGLFGTKFILISFQFMDLKKAHPFWKTALTFLLVMYITFAAVALNLA